LPANAPLHAFIMHVKDGIALDWTDFDIAGSVVTSGNSVYQDTAVGVFMTNPSTGTNGYVATILYFASFTRMTPDGIAPVECLRAGMLVLTSSGRSGTDHLAWPPQSGSTKHPRPTFVWPARVQAGTFADDVPKRDCGSSPDHAILRTECWSRSST